MLSVIIPTYNYSAYELADEIRQQCEETEIGYEIIVLDDASSDLLSLEKNEKINQFYHGKFEKSETNLGRAGNINKLIQKARFEWILLLDCDVKPVKENYIKNYLNCINKEYKITFGGIEYKNEKPEKEKLLRWFYGKKREEISAVERNKNPFRTTLTSNILVHKKVFDTTRFNEQITEYGYEDLVFAESLKKNNFTINHIDNPCYHLNYETSEIFITKIETALRNLVRLEEKGIINNDITQLQLTYLKAKRYNFVFLISIAHNIFHKIILLNLKSGKPFLFLLDFLKLGIYSKLKSYKE